MRPRALTSARRLLAGAAIALVAIAASEPQALGHLIGGQPVDAQLRTELTAQGFTGRVESTLEERLGRPVNRTLANTGRLLWFDTVTGLNGDNTCAGCHSPLTGFGDTQSIAIGIDNNGIVGPDRSGPRNLRRAPLVINTAFYPRLMWNSRFAALSGDPFDNGAGFEFPLPEGLSLSGMPHLLVAQAFIPPTERTEVAGFDVPRRQRRHPGRGGAPAQRRPRVPAPVRRSLPEGEKRRPITFEMFALCDRRVRVLADVRERSDRPVCARRARTR